MPNSIINKLIEFILFLIDSYFNCHISHLLLTSCTDSYIGLTFKVGWGSRSVYSSTSASSGWPPGTSPTIVSQYKYRPLTPCIQPGSRSIFSSSLERELRQSALVASSMPHPPFGTHSPNDLRDPELSSGSFRNKVKTFLFPKFNASHFLIWSYVYYQFIFFSFSSILYRARQCDI